MAEGLPLDKFGASPIHTRGVLDAPCVSLGVWL